MKKIIYFLLGIYSICCFGQSDLEIESYFAGSPGAVHYKGDELIWSLKVTNKGANRASVSIYNIFLSENETYENTDLKLIEGKISGDGFINILGLGAGNSTTQNEINEGRIIIPFNIEANKSYFLIFKVEQDSDKNEVNLANNVATQKIKIGLKNGLISVTPEDSIESNIGEKKPLLLIHGYQPDGKPALPNVGIWDNFIKYFYKDDELKNKYKIYYVSYFSNIIDIDDLGHSLRIVLDDKNEFSNKTLTLIAHSMGGLVARSFAKRKRDTENNGEYDGKFGGERVDKLITLGTPHHGNPLANGDIRYQKVIFDSSLNLLEQLQDIRSDNGVYFVNSPKYDEVNRSNLKWDNYDNLFNYSTSSSVNEKNDWLNSVKMNGDPDNYFDIKIIAYAGMFSENLSWADRRRNSYFITEAYLIDMGFLSDGVVPLLSANFDEHLVRERFEFEGYYHDEIAKGREDRINSDGLDLFLFDHIKKNLIDEQINNVSNIYAPNKIINFQEVPLNKTVEKTFNIQNVSNNILKILSIELVGTDDNGFSFNAPNISFDIKANGKQPITVNFEPKSIGNKSIKLRINNSSENEPVLDILLNGLAVENATTDYNINNESLFDFGEVYIYEGNKTITLNISNSRSAPYKVNELNITGLNSSLFNIVHQPVLPKVFNPGDHDFVVLSFDPDTTGEKTATIEARFADNTILDTADLIGKGVDFYNDPNTPKLALYEYWFNSEYSSRQSINLEATKSIENVDFDANMLNLPSGLSIFHFRVKDNEGSWSSVLSNYVFIQKVPSNIGSKITNYEFWFDDNYDNKIIGFTENKSTLLFNFDVNADNLEKGLHRFHVRFKDSKQVWSSISSEFILKTNNAQSDTNKITGYKYWLNESYETVIKEDIEPRENFILLDELELSDLTNNSANYLHFQFKDTFGNWSSVLTKEFIYDKTLNIDSFGKDEFKIFPNPTKNIINIISPTDKGLLKVFNPIGKLILEKNNIPKTIDLTGFSDGFYIIKIEIKDKIIQTKVIKN